MKKAYVAGMLVIGLAAAFVLGQAVVLPVRECAAVERSNKDSLDSYEAETSAAAIAAWENQNEADDNPWGKTADIIDTEDGNQAIFLTPGTGVEISCHVDEADTHLTLVYYIHPWVAEASDGLHFTVTVNDTIIEDIQIEQDDVLKTKQMDIDLSDYEGEAVLIEIRNLMEDGAKLDGDWLVLESGGEKTLIK